MIKTPDQVDESRKNAAAFISEDNNNSFVRALPVIIGVIVVFALSEFLKDTLFPNLTRVQTNIASIFLVAVISALFVLWFNQTSKKKNQEIKAPFIGELSGHFFFSAFAEGPKERTDKMIRRKGGLPHHSPDSIVFSQPSRPVNREHWFTVFV
mgnify:CR=1 FL=1